MIQKKPKMIVNPLLKNKYLNLPLFILLCCTAAYAQTQPVNTGQPKQMVDMREKLVTLALQNPNYEIADRKVAIAAYQVKKAKGSWLNVVTLTGNVNEFAFKGTTIVNGVPYNPSAFFPKYNIGATIPLNIISEKRNDVKIARENMSVAEAEKNQRFREIKADVLTKYEDFLLCQQKLELQAQVLQDAKTLLAASEKDFQEGSIKQDEYNKSYRGYTDEKIKQAESLRNYNVIKLELEKLIGMTMEDAMKK